MAAFDLCLALGSVVLCRVILCSIKQSEITPKNPTRYWKRHWLFGHYCSAVETNHETIMIQYSTSQALLFRYEIVSSQARSSSSESQVHCNDIPPPKLTLTKCPSSDKLWRQYPHIVT